MAVPSTFEALAVVAFGLLPGALYIWSFERIAGRWGAALTDRAFRFIGSSAVLQALVAPVTYWFWTDQRPKLAPGGPDPDLWRSWGFTIGYVALPLVLGSVVGRATRNEKRWVKVITGPDPAPRAWDYLFQGERDGWVRLRMKSGVWLGGAYATSVDAELKSYTAGYPEQPQDIYLASAVVVDASTGEFVFGADGKPERTGSGLLVRWDEVEYLEFIDG